MSAISRRNAKKSTGGAPARAGRCRQLDGVIRSRAQKRRSGMSAASRHNTKKKCGEAQERVWGCRQIDGVIRRRAQKRRADKCRQLADLIRRRAEMGMPSNRRRNSKKGTEKASGNVGR